VVDSSLFGRNRIVRVCRCEPFHFTVDHCIHVELWTRVVLTTVDEPLDERDDEDDGERNDAVVHVVACYREVGGKYEKHGGQDGPEYSGLRLSVLER